tara:strand:- start:53 stop:430 length:378 start_codon:yes stop_codon:yes gene_type:complete
VIDKLIGPVSSIIDKVIPDKDQAAKLAHEVATMADKHSQELALAQLEILKSDAKGNWFQSSWRPLIGWLGGIGLGVNYIVSPICAGFGVIVPQADMSVMMPLLLGMLGMAGARSFDKLNKTDTKK